LTWDASGLLCDCRGKGHRLHRHLRRHTILHDRSGQYQGSFSLLMPYCLLPWVSWDVQVWLANVVCRRLPCSCIRICHVHTSCVDVRTPECIPSSSCRSNRLNSRTQVANCNNGIVIHLSNLFFNTLMSIHARHIQPS